MGEFTALDDPLVDQRVESHLERIVSALRTRMEPDAVILRGSFGRGEGSVLSGNGQLRFLSDYEIDVATFSPTYRSLFRKLSNQLTAEFGVETGLRWVRPDYMVKSRVGPVPVGPAPITIALYESRYGSRTLYGRELVQISPPIDPRNISLVSGLKLLLNRMAESLYYVPGAGSTTDELAVCYWMNKTILACAESLLMLWGQYHYSYEERGRRFAAMANERLAFMPEQAGLLAELVARATEFKLRPRRGLYPEAIRETWLQMAHVCDPVFQHLLDQVLGISFDGYARLPGQYLQYEAGVSRSWSRLHCVMVKSLSVYRYLNQRLLPRGLLLPYGVSSVVYAVVPLMFTGWASSAEELPALLREARQWLSVVWPLPPPEPDPGNELRALQQRMLWAWKSLCY